MTTNLATTTKSSDTQSAEAMAFAIGEVDAHVFNCPSCARPLSDGTSRCPGCGAHLIMGVRLKRAAAILGLGVAIGILLGGATTAAAITMSLREESAAVVAPVASATPSAAPSPTPSFFVSDPRAPQAAVSALSGTAVVNGRIAVDAQTLSSTLARSSASTNEMARALRSLAADATLGTDLAGRLANWPEASDAQAVLDDFYRSMGREAKAGLRASLSDKAAYRRAGTQMLSVLARLGDVDSQSRTLAATIELELPPVVLPKLAS